MRRCHKLGDQQIASLWDWTREMQNRYDDINFTAPIFVENHGFFVCGDRDPLYPVEMALAMYRAIPRSALWVAQTAATAPSSPMQRLNSLKQHSRSFELRVSWTHR
jgi:hypothetical protein